MKTLKNWVLNRQAADHVELKVDGQHLFRIYILESGLFRVLIKQRGELALNRTWSIAQQTDVPWEGRDRESTEGFARPAFELVQCDAELCISTDKCG